MLALKLKLNNNVIEFLYRGKALPKSGVLFLLSYSGSISPNLLQSESALYASIAFAGTRRTAVVGIPSNDVGCTSGGMVERTVTSSSCQHSLKAWLPI